MTSAKETDQRGGEDRSAAALESAIVQASLDEARLQAQLAGLVDRRNERLLAGTDDEVDAVEVELDVVTRQLDRLELRLPLLRARHAEQLAAEQRAARREGFDTAVVARLAAAEALDDALDRLGAAFRLFKAAERRLQTAGVMVGSEAERDLLGAVRLAAPEFMRAAGMRDAILLDPRPLAEAERAKWARFRSSGGLDAFGSARAAADRAPALPPVSADELEKSGRYGRTIVVSIEEDSDALAA